MKILVPVKRVIDYEAKIKVKPDGSGVQTDGIKWIVNPFDEIAVEEAMRLKEAGVCEDVTVVCVGPADASKELRTAMAMGADRAILIKSDALVDSDLAARAIVEVYKKADYDLIIMGKQAIDSDAGQTPQLIAEHLDITHASYASKIEIADGAATVVREVDGGLETIKVVLPCVLSTDLRLNEPRYVPLPGIMKAKKKPLDEIPIEDLGIDLECKVKVLKMHAPEGRQAGRKVESVEELVSALKNEAKVL